MVRGLADLAEAAVAWNQIAPLFNAAARAEKAAPEAALLAATPAAATAATADRPGESAVVEAHDLVFPLWRARRPPDVAGDRSSVRKASLIRKGICEPASQITPVLPPFDV